MKKILASSDGTVINVSELLAAKGGDRVRVNLARSTENKKPETAI